jgi:AAA15 family ATPase/GTPase
MAIERVKVENYRILRSVDLTLDPDLNVFVGDNESGKSTLLEAINLALKCQLGRRPASYELHPFLFNTSAVADFIQSYKDDDPGIPPEILIEIYLSDDAEYAELKGTNNSEGENKPGISFRICFDEDLKDEYEAYFADPEKIGTLPVEFYQIEWRDFAGQIMNPRKLPVQSALIDPSAISNTYAANKFVLETIRDFLTKEQNVNLSLSYRGMREKFLGQEGVVEINDALAEKKDIISNKTLSVAMDTTTRASWETGVIPHLDEIPLTLVGKGEQSSVKIKLAVEAQDQCEVLLMEEPENHLTHANLNRLVNHLAGKAEGRQLILTTHSSEPPRVYRRLFCVSQAAIA